MGAVIKQIRNCLFVSPFYFNRVFVSVILLITLINFATCLDLNTSEIYSIKIEALQAESVVRDKADRITNQANLLIREANDSLGEMLSSESVLSEITLTEGVGYAIDEAEKIVHLADYIFHNSRNRSSDVREWSRKSIKDAYKSEQGMKDYATSDDDDATDSEDDATSDQSENDDDEDDKNDKNDE